MKIPEYSSFIYFILLGVIVLFKSCTKDFDESNIEQSNEKQLLTFEFNKAINPELILDERLGTVNENNKLVNISISEAVQTNVLIPTITISEKATISPKNGEAQDFSEPVTYTVTAENNSTTSYIVELQKLDSKAEILSFSFFAIDNENLEQDVIGMIDQESKEIDFIAPFGTDLSSLIPSIVISEKSTLNNATNTAQDFTQEINYIVTAEDQSTVTYRVTGFNEQITEREALIALYDANPGNTLNWDINNEDISLWEGVGLSVDGTIDRLTLSSVGVTVLPKELAVLTSLKILEIGNNAISDFPENIFLISSLEELFISNNPISDIPDGITNLKKLITLNLFGNNFNKIPEILRELENLQNLYMGKNSITSIRNGYFENFALREFGLFGNGITTFPEQIKDLKSIEKLYIGGNFFSELPEFIADLENINLLSIEGNDNLKTIPQSICDLENNGLEIIKDDTVTCE